MKPITLNQSEKDDVAELYRQNDSFYRNVILKKYDYSNVVINELKNILFGKIPRNFVINIRGRIGRQTGIFKSTFGLQLALFQLDPYFNVEERVAFTVNELNEKIKKYGTSKQLFVLDEQVKDLKQSAEIRLQNIVNSCRDKQLSFIFIGVGERFLTFSDYHFERFGESDDKYLNKEIQIGNTKFITGDKTIMYLVKKITEGSHYYRGFIKWKVIPFTNKKWRDFWKIYYQRKQEHEQKAMKQILTGYDFEIKAKDVMKCKEFLEICVKTKEGITIDKGKLKNLIYKQMPDNTNEERQMVYREIV